MKKRNIIAVLSALSCLALLPIVQAAQAQDTPDPGSVGGAFNTADGTNALGNASGSANSAFGWWALFSNADASFNTAVGAGALLSNNGSPNTAVGAAALLFNTTGGENVAVGAAALVNNADGGDNNAVGAFALNANVSGSFNNAHGRDALLNSTGDQNNAIGDDAMFFNTTGSSNTAIGDDALGNNVDGNSNVAIGDEAGTGLGPSVNNCIAIGVPGAGDFATFDNTCFIGSIFDQPVSDVGTQEAVFVDQFNNVGISASSRRFKHDIQPMDKTSEAILALKPVTFHYKSDNTNRPEFGLIAEEVAEVNRDLVVRDENGEIYTVRYDAVNAMLLNEFLKEHRKVENLEATVAQQHKDFEAAVAELKGQIQKVSAQLELSKSAPQTVLSLQ